MSARPVVECFACDLGAVASAIYGAGKEARRVLLCRYHADELGRCRSFAGAAEKRARDKLEAGRRK